MPRRLPSTESSAAYVFPIVAAFLCTAGALCTLVYGYDRQGAHVAHVAGVLKEARDDAEELIAQRELLAVRSLHLGQSRDKTQAELALKQAELSHIEDHTRRLREQAEKLSLAIRELENKDGSQAREVNAAQAELDRLQRAIVAAEAELKEKELANRDRPVTYSVVPYEGPNQTKRRPIYIECRRDSVVIQPEGVILRDRDFEPPLGPGNPLAAAIRAYSEYLARAGFTGETTRPYPMLLVRPDGIEAYYAARAALQTWGTEFGYELVGEDWKLEYPPLEPRLTTVLDQIVEDARMRQDALAAAAPRQFKRAPTALRASPNGRGFIAEGDSSGRSRYGGSGYASRSTESRFGARGRGTGSGWGDGTSGTGAEPGGAAADGFGGGNSAVPGGGPGAGRGDGLASDGFASAGREAGNGLSGFENSNVAGTGNGGRTGAPSSGQPGLSAAPENAGTFGSPQPPGSDGRPGGSYAAADGTQPSSPGGAAEGYPFGRGTDATGSAFGDPRAANAGQSGESGNQKNEMGPFGSSGQGFQANKQQAASGGAGDARVGGQPGGAGSPQSGPSGGGQSSQGESQGMPSATAHVSPPGKKPSSIANKRGRDWGLPDGSASMVPVTRPIIIRCEPHQLTIMPEDNRMLPQTIPLAGRTDAAVDKLVSGVWDYMKGWGLAGRGMYWRPTLSMEVAPGAEGRFDELQALLQDSGMEVKRRQTPSQRR